MRWLDWLLLVAALLLFTVQAGWSSTRKSAAFDEQYHLAAGYSYLVTGDFRLATNHPPLAGWLAALPLRFDAAITLPTEHPSWLNGDRFLFSDIFLWESGNDVQSILLRARWMITALGGLLVVSIFFAARQIVGVRAGWLALLLAITEPNLIAHSRFVTTDLPLTLFIFLAVWWWWRWLMWLRWYDVVLAGIFAGLAMGAKYNGGLVWAILGLMTLLQPLTPLAMARRQIWQRRVAGIGVAGVTALGILWILFRLTVGPVDFLPNWVQLPAPHYWQWFWNTIVRIVDLQGARVDFFLGETSNRYWWNYFLVAAGVKLSLPVLFLTLAGLWFLVRTHTVRAYCALWLPPTLLMLLGATQVLNIGFRHMLPAIPFVLLLGASVAERSTWVFAKPARAALATGVLMLWLIVDVARIAPHYESFFNQFAGPWQNWSNLLVDSNLDWGQDLIELREVMAANNIERVNLAYFGKAAPEAYGVAYQPLPSYLRFTEGREIAAYNPYTPEPGWYAISATALRTGLMTPETVDLYRAFRSQTPDARAGFSIYLYNLTYPPTTAVTRPTVFGEPVWSIPADDLGITPTTRAMVKWIDAPDVNVIAQGAAAPALDTSDFVSVDANFDQVLAFLGYAKSNAPLYPGANLALTLYWQVGDKSMPQPAPTRGAPLSAFVHIVDGDPANKVAEFDSWNVALRGLEPGDIIAQQALLHIPEDAEAKSYDLLVGLYSPQNWQRLTTTHAGEPRDYAVAGSVEVQTASP